MGGGGGKSTAHAALGAPHPLVIVAAPSEKKGGIYV